MDTRAASTYYKSVVLDKWTDVTFPGVLETQSVCAPSTAQLQNKIYNKIVQRRIENVNDLFVHFVFTKLSEFL